MTDNPTDYKAVYIQCEPNAPNYWGVAREEHIYLDKHEADELVKTLNNMNKEAK